MEKVYEVMKERSVFIPVLNTAGKYIFEDSTFYDANAIRKKWKLKKK